MADDFTLEDLGIGLSRDGLLLAPPARGKTPAALFHAYERDLNESDISLLLSAPSRETTTPSINKLKQSHHALARLIAEGRPHVEVAAITGYSQSRISLLMDDPAFAELVGFYSGQVAEVYLNVHQRLASLGLDALEELHDRLNDPEAPDFSNRELQDIVALTFDRAGYGPRSTQVNEFKFSIDGLLSAVKDEVRTRQHGSIKTLDARPNQPQAPSDLGPEEGADPISSPGLHSEESGARRQSDGSPVREPSRQETFIPSNENGEDRG